MVWKEIENFPGYFVSDTGEVKSTKYWGQFKRQNSDGLLNQRTYKAGYKYVNLYKNGHMYSVKVHRLVAQAFIPNPNNYPQVNHIDEDKSNNCVENLEWCSVEQNLSHNDLQKRAHLKQKRKIGAYNKQGVLFKNFDSATDAAFYVVHENIAKTFRSAVANICWSANQENLLLRYGFYWRWLEESHRKKI